MYIQGIKRPAQALNDYHPKGTQVILELDYGECILIDHALHSYKKEHKDMGDEDKYFMWQFIFLRDILKNGVIDSFNCSLFEAMFTHKKDKEIEACKAVEEEENNDSIKK